MDRSLPLDALDSRVVLLGYALIVSPAGLVVALWGPVWINGPLNGLPFGLESLVRMVGSAALAAGLSGFAIGQISDAIERRRALLWFAIAHASVFLMAALQSAMIWDASYRHELYWPMVSLGLACFWLIFGWQRQAGDPAPYSLYQSLFRPRPGSATERLKSDYERQMRALGAQEERNRLARDLHDSVKQQLFAIQAAAATAETRFASDPVGSRAALAQVREVGRDAMSEMEAMVDQLRATPTENAGLVGAIRHQCEATRIRTGAAVTCEIGALPANEALPPGVHLALFRVCQEALSNVARHARASHVRVVLERRGARLELTVEDNGLGFDVAPDSTGMGLRNIRLRVDELGGDTHVRSVKGTGTTVFVSVPFMDGDPRHYLRQAGWRAAALAIAVALLATPMPSGRPSPIGFLSMLFALDMTRYLVAWHRATRLRSAAS